MNRRKSGQTISYNVGVAAIRIRPCTMRTGWRPQETALSARGRADRAGGVCHGGLGHDVQPRITVDFG